MSDLKKDLAMRVTPIVALKYGWGKEINKLCGALGFRNHYPDLPNFIAEVHKWQKSNPPLKANGVLDSDTWKKLAPKIAAIKDEFVYQAPHPSWITDINANVYASDDEHALYEMAKIALKQKDDVYTPVPISANLAAYIMKKGSTNSLYTGLPISQTLEVGQKWDVLGAPRIILSITNGGLSKYSSLIFVTDQGQLYDQRVVGFESDLFVTLYVGLAEKLAPVKLLLDVTAAVLRGALTATVPGATTFFVGVGVIQFVAEHKEDIPKYLEIIWRFAIVQQTLRSNAPTLNDKILLILLKKLAVEIPGSISNDPKLIGHFFGGLIASLGSSRWKTMLLEEFKTIAGHIVGVLKKIIIAVLKAVPGAGKAAVQTVSDNLIGEVKALGFSLSLNDAQKIVGEVQKNEAIIKKVLGDLLDALSKVVTVERSS